MTDEVVGERPVAVGVAEVRAIGPDFLACPCMGVNLLMLLLWCC
jgi:hypothetical protein